MLLGHPVYNARTCSIHIYSVYMYIILYIIYTCNNTIKRENQIEREKKL